jgi:uncharacterized protein
VPVDLAAAQRWLEAAADRGHEEAQKMLRRYAARGLVGNGDPKAAHLRLGRAAVWTSKATERESN